MLIVCHIYYWMSPLFENQRVLFHITKRCNSKRHLCLLLLHLFVISKTFLRVLSQLCFIGG